MKAYFLGSISGKKNYLRNYKRIVEILDQLGVKVAEYTIKSSEEYISSLSDKDKVNYYRQILKTINKVDIVVAEGSYPSMGVGYEISLAIEKNKPVIVLYEKGHAPHFIEGLQSEKLLVIKYEFKDLEKEVRSAIEYAAEMQDTRFNFFIAPKHQSYLDWIAKNRKTPRAVHLRRLLEKDMKSNKAYQADLAGDKKK